MKAGRSSQYELLFQEDQTRIDYIRDIEHETSVPTEEDTIEPRIPVGFSAKGMGIQ
jgi:hypothetical protein